MVLFILLMLWYVIDRQASYKSTNMGIIWQYNNFYQILKMGQIGSE